MLDMLKRCSMLQEMLFRGLHDKISQSVASSCTRFNFQYAGSTMISLQHILNSSEVKLFGNMTRGVGIPCKPLDAELANFFWGIREQ